jgi:hypothetical protein
MSALIQIKDMARHFLPRPIVRVLYRWMAQRYIAGLRPVWDPDRPTILVINHLYDQDLRALRHANRRYNLVVVDFEIMFKSGKLYFSKPVRALLSPYDGEPEGRRLAYRAECRLMFAALRRRFHPAVILTPSDNFAFIREFLTAAREVGVPTVVYDKEGTISPYALAGHAARIRHFAPFMSDHLFVWSRRQVQFWNNIGVPASRITVVGQARSDLFFAEASRDVDRLFSVVRPLITCFSFDDKAYIPPEYLDRGITWRQLKSEIMADLMALAAANPGYNFVVKAHPQQLDLEALQRQYRRDNLVVVGGAQIGNELIQRSELIIAFQTTAVIEAMLLKRRVIYTAWDETYNQLLLDDLLPFHRAEGIVIARTRAQFNDVCRRFFAGDLSDFDFSPEQETAREQFVNEYLYKPDGHVCERFFAELDRFLNETAVR